MRKNALVFALIVLLLSGCDTKIDVDYTVFSAAFNTYEESESVEEDIYAVYYYDSKDEKSDEAYESFLKLYNQFDTFKLYVLDTAELTNETSNFGEYSTEPIIYLVRNNSVAETFKGVDGVTAFSLKYSELDYSVFEDKMVNDITKSLMITDDLHFEYYYSDICSHCKLVKPDLLYFFLVNEDLDLYLWNTGKFEEKVSIEGYLGTPALYVVDNNVVIASYVGSLQIPEFIEGYNSGEITFD